MGKLHLLNFRLGNNRELKFYFSYKLKSGTFYDIGDTIIINFEF
jgi:hypothetical protein